MATVVITISDEEGVVVTDVSADPEFDSDDDLTPAQETALQVLAMIHDGLECAGGTH